MFRVLETLSTNILCLVKKENNLMESKRFKTINLFKSKTTTDSHILTIFNKLFDILTYFLTYLTY